MEEDTEVEREPQACGLVMLCFKVLRCMRRHWLLIAMITSVILAIVVGFIVRAVFLTEEKTSFTRREIMYTAFLGKLFVRVLRAVTIPLFVFSVISSLGRLNMKTSGKLGARAFLYFISTSFCSTIIGVILVLAIRPGASVTDRERFGEQEVVPSLPVDNILDFFRNLMPENIVAACLTGVRTSLKPPPRNESEPSEPLPPLEEWEYDTERSGQTNYLGLISVAVVVGILMSYMGEEVGSFYHLVDMLNEVFIRITIWAVWCSPPCIFCLMLAQMMEITDWTETVRQMGLYTVANLVGLAIIAFIFLPAVYSIFLRKLPFKFMYQCIEIVTTAFVTSSSVATMPMTITILEETVGINPHITRFIVPLGATVNMNGAALYETIGPLFLAQMRNVDLNIGHYLAVCAMAALASVGVAGIPQGGIVTMVMVMNIVSVPPEDISIIIAMDWLLDRFDTACNVFGDTVGCAVVERLSKKELEALGERKHEN